MQSVKRLGSIRQFCVALLDACPGIGADFTDLPECLKQAVCDVKAVNEESAFYGGIDIASRTASSA